ncbi:MAG: class 1 fructose-bisphosphatase [Bacteroidales bacterium]|nr:class 1 fructose-bisphosphatase [Bacteroidales bacterium]MCF8386479.1 class 1 fructose-bisphosphatase [Bacteroidales bacterium]MCF8399405.1 class 1 fructose-bisphosphatase [Bacteroidales bacterium]
MKTLIEFINEKQADFPYATGEFTRLLNDIGIAAKIVNREVNKAGLANILGYEGNTNIQGEDQKKLDVFANKEFTKALKHGGQCAAIISEEDEEVVIFDNETSKKGKYIIAIDPLDGSSNIEVNVSIGTVFAIYRRRDHHESVHNEDLLRPGVDLAAAGYVIYGSSTMLVYSTGNGVNGFTLDPSVGLFILSHPEMKLPEDGAIYSINEAYYNNFPEGIKRYMKYCQEEDPATNRPYKTRYIGSLVADFHRNLIRGGIYIYPGTTKNPAGKLRLLYECNPVAYLAEHAGGKASDGFKRTLEIQPNDIHQRTPLFVGSKKMVEKAEEFMRKYSKDFPDEYL